MTRRHKLFHILIAPKIKRNIDQNKKKYTKKKEMKTRKSIKHTYSLLD